MTDFQCVAIYGVGRFGYAMLQHLQHKVPQGLSLRAYDRDEHVRRELVEHRRHPYHDSEAPLNTGVEIADSPAELLRDRQALIFAVSSESSREVAGVVAQAPWPGPLTIVNTAKALDYQTGRRLSEVVARVMRETPPPHTYTYAALAGGTIASDLLHEEPLGMTIACEDDGALSPLTRLFESPNLWAQATTDLVGVEYAGALKNVIAICAGMVRGQGYSYGAVTHLISRLASEIENFCVDRLGARRETFSIGSQCWGSDLWMSCTGPTRNGALGELLGQGMSLDEANRRMAEQRKTVEGVQTLRAIGAFVERYPEQLPLLLIAKRIILDGQPPQTLIDALMRREQT